MLIPAERRLETAGLLERAVAGDLAAFEDIVRMHEKQVLNTAWRLLGSLEDAQDTAQEAFLRLFSNLKRLDDVRQVRPWLYRVTVNLCFDHRRRNRNFPGEGLGGLEAATPGLDPEITWLAQERRAILERGLATLPEKERAAVVLRDVEGLDTREVAEILGSSETTVRSQICVARAKLRKFVLRRKP
jgi:RNA polymerase sigma-70 factor (ECF subfamily)